MQFRITLMFHEIQDFPEIVLDELDIEAQYGMVEHVHSMAVAEPVQLGEIEVEEKRRQGYEALHSMPCTACTRALHYAALVAH